MTGKVPSLVVDVLVVAATWLVAVLCLFAAIWQIRADNWLIAAAFTGVGLVLAVYLLGILWKGIKS